MSHSSVSSFSSSSEHRRNSLGFEFVPDDSWLQEVSRRPSAASEADTDSAFVDDDLESSWDQLRLRQFKEQLSISEQPEQSRRHLLLQRLKRLCSLTLLTNGNVGLDSYERIMLVMLLLLIADTILLCYLLAAYPVYSDLLQRFGINFLRNSTSEFFQAASAQRDL